MAWSRFRLVHAASGVAEVAVEILTGRTHQIRAHLADVGHPLLMDELYGGSNVARRLKDGVVRTAVEQLHRQALHAEALAFAHPLRGTQLSFTSALPPDLARIREAMRGIA